MNGQIKYKIEHNVHHAGEIIMTTEFNKNHLSLICISMGMRM
jgi:hypothetical protein